MMREKLEGKRRHSGTGNLQYASDADNVGMCYCYDCKRWVPAPKWTEPCPSNRERRSSDRRAILSAEPDPSLRKRVDAILSEVCHAELTDRICALFEGAGGLREDEQGMHWKKRAYDTLAKYGVPFERARSIANGIRVLATRYEKEIEALRASPPPVDPGLLSDAAKLLDVAGMWKTPVDEQWRMSYADWRARYAARTPPQKPAETYERSKVGRPPTKSPPRSMHDAVYHEGRTAETPQRFVCKGCGKEMDPAYEAVWSGGTERHWDVKAQAWCGPVERTV